MKKQKSQKVLKWKTKDVVLNAITYVLNTIFIAMLFVGTIYIEARSGNVDFEAYIKNATNLLHFFILLLLLIALMASYLFFEDKDFLKNAVNSEMLFLIIEISLASTVKSTAYHAVPRYSV